MGLIRVPNEGRTIDTPSAVRQFLSQYGIEYERWALAPGVPEDTAAEQLLEAYAPRLEALKAHGGYIHADVIDVHVDTPGIESMLAKFRVEHWHDEDEVRFIVAGRGLFHIHPPMAPVFAIEVEAGDLIRVPRGTLHWFDLCAERRIRAIRLFQDRSGWTPQYSNSGIDGEFQPVCFGPTYIVPFPAA